MKTLIQKINIEENHSFACRIYRTPHFETNWHQHEEIELITIVEGMGTVMIGDFVGEYHPGDVFFIASNLPHWFRKNHPSIIGSAIVAQFNKNIFGEQFLLNPELKSIYTLVEKNEGLKLERKLKLTIVQLLQEIASADRFNRMSLLLHALNKIGSSSAFKVVTKNFNISKNSINPTIERIIDYSFKHYLESVKLEEVASMAKMTIPTFCRFFKKNIKKTYFEFLQELRINHACKLLNTTDLPVMEICYESGYNSWAHFSRQFKKIKEISPTAYRKAFAKITE